MKFMRLAQSRLAALGTGVLGYITSNSYLESPTFRGVRQSLLHSYPQLRIVDLHGNANKGEISGGDENVFEIKEGVAIAIGSVNPGMAIRIEHADLSGPRHIKCDRLLSEGLGILSPFAPMGEKLQLARSDAFGIGEYELGWPLPTISPLNSAGIITARDALTIQFSEKQVWDTVRDFAKREVEDVREAYSLGDDSRDWQVELAQKDVNGTGPNKRHLQPLLYRPFDIRQTYYTGQTRGFLCMPRPEVMRHMLEGRNLGLISCRQMSQANEEWALVGVSRLPIEGCAISNKTKEINYLFPLWRHQEVGQAENLSTSFLAAMQSALRLTPADYRPEDPTAPLHAEKIFHYVYAVLHSPAYRQRYAAFLRTDFPRIPIPGSRAVFDALAQLGGQLVQWHLLEHPDAIKIVAGSEYPESATAFFGTDLSLQKVAETGKTLAELSGDVGKVFINATSGFANVRLATWQHTIGGYQVLHKWLDDRRKAGRSLSQDDITHWLRVYAALEATQALMQQVDEAIDAHGGWPGAFSQNHPPPDAATLAVEQAAQKEQLKAHKKAAIKKVARDAGTGWTEGLFDSDSDLDEMATAAGAPPRPKSEAAPAKAAGGKTSSATPRAEDLTDDQLMCALRAVLAESGALAPNDLIRQTARRLGFARTAAPLRAVLEKAIGRAVRRGIAAQADGLLSLEVKSIEGYDRDFLKQHLLGVVGRAWRGTAEVPVRFARALGFARTGPKIEETVWKLMRALVRAGQVEIQGRAASARYRKARTVR
ncbi:MAG: hypothetical protein I8H91_10475 [Burkholderiales bacterium]|nr:hypothetical protein [Burkholderiales bacterium]